MILHDAEFKLLRYSLVFVWLTTAFVSIWESDGMSFALLKDAGLDKPVLANLAIYGAAGVDLIFGLAMLFKPNKRVYLAALIVMMLMTLIATFFAPQLWLHPLGPLTKNIPIAVILFVLMKAR
jgi:hypothetical protein